MFLIMSNLGLHIPQSEVFCLDGPFFQRAVGWAGRMESFVMLLKQRDR